MRVEVLRVFGVSERLQPVTEAPSSVTIVTASEISRFGYRTLADILRGVRGFYVTDDRNYSYIGVRGFSSPGDYSTKVLLLVNGHRVNDDVYDMAAIGADLGIDVAMFDRVEIIRGPASALYGTSAFFAVVNVVTKSGASLDGASFALDGGSLGTGLVRASAGRRLADGVDLALSGTYERSDGMARLYFPAFDSQDTNNGVAENLDGERDGQLYAQLRAHDLAITATFGRRDKYVPTASFGTLFNEHGTPEKTRDTRAMIQSRYETAFGKTRVAVDAAFDRYRYGGVYPYAGATPDAPSEIDEDGALGTKWSIEGRVTRPIAGHQTIVAGGEFVDNLRQNQWEYYGQEPLIQAFGRSNRSALFVQDEVKITRWLILNGGLRTDNYDSFRRTTPRGAVIVAPTPNQSFKYLYGQAFRAPNAYEQVLLLDRAAEPRARVDRHARDCLGAVHRRMAQNFRVRVSIQRDEAPQPAGHFGHGAHGRDGCRLHLRQFRGDRRGRSGARS